MATVTVRGSNLGNSLQTLLMAEDIVPGAAPSYATCKTIFTYHVLGQKMAESPVKMAQSQARTIAVPNAPEELVKDAFEREWIRIGASKHIANVTTLSRVYGIASIAVLDNGKTDEPLDFKKLSKEEIAFNVLDPLNTAGSLVLDQNPNSPTFLKTTDIVVSGRKYHRSRSVVMMNESPIYIEYTTSAFGFVGRSVYQRAFFPLKSFVQSMITDDMVVRKAGVLVAMMKQVGSIVDRLQQTIFGQKRALLKEAETDNVISIGESEKIETLNMQNLDGAYGLARTNIIKNIATAADMPAWFLDNETMAEGFGEGTEDAKNIARYIDNIRETMAPLYSWFDRIVMHRAWNEEFYKTIQNTHPDEYGDVPYETAFYQWVDSFKAVWPNLLTEPESEKAKTDEVRLKAMIDAVESLSPMLDPQNKTNLIEWVCDNFSSLKILFPNPLVIDTDLLLAHLLKQAANLNTQPDDEEKDEPKPSEARLGSRRTLRLASR